VQLSHVDPSASSLEEAVMPNLASNVRSPKTHRSIRRTSPRSSRARAQARDLPLQLLALALMTDGRGADPATTANVEAQLREGLRAADAILAHSLASAPETTVEDLLVQRATASRQYAAVAAALPTDINLSSIVCDTARDGVFAGMALAYLFFVGDAQ
jgi:hypothetical protein